jgi:hypothetical protein
MTEKSSVAHQFIARGLDQNSAIHNIEIGRAETLYNFDTDTQGFISKRKGYQLYRNIPIRVLGAADRGDNWEFVADKSIDFIGVNSSPIVINGQAINTNTNELETVSFYWDQFQNLGAFTLTGTFDAAEGVYKATTNLLHLESLDLMVGVLTQDGTELTGLTNNNKAILTEEIINKDNNDETFEVTIEVESPVQFTEQNTFTVVRPENSIIQSPNSFYTETFTSMTPTPINLGENTLNIPKNTHNLGGENFVVQVWQDTNGSGFSRKIVLPEAIEINANADVEITINVTTTNPIHVYIAAVNDAFQTSAYINQSPDFTEANKRSFVIDDVTSYANLWSFYRQDNTGTQTLVIPEDVRYDATTQQLTFEFFPAVDSIFKAVYLPATSVNAGIIVSKTDNSFCEKGGVPLRNNQNTAIYDLTNADLMFQGINWDQIVIDGTTPEFGYVREVEQYKSTVYDRLVSVCSGDFWIEDLDVNYTITASNFAEQSNTVQYLTPYFGASEEAISQGIINSRSRGLTATEIPEGTNFVQVDKIEIMDQGSNTTKAKVTTIPLTNINGTLSGIVMNFDKLTIEDDEYDLYNGEHVITSATLNGSQLEFEILVENIKSYSPNSLNSPAICGILTDYIIVTPETIGNIEVGDIINNLGGLIGSEVLAVDTDNNRMWLNGIQQERFLQGFIDITWDRITNVIKLDPTELCLSNAVPFDIINISGYARKFKILEINTDTNEITINESIRICNFFGSATKISLDGRLTLPIKPKSNITKTFPFASTGEYSVEMATLNDSLYTTTYDRSVIKFDGTHISDAGILEYPLYSHSWLVPKTDTNTGGFIEPNSIAGKVPQLNGVDPNVSITVVFENNLPQTVNPVNQEFPVFSSDQQVSIQNSTGDIFDVTIESIDNDTNTIVFSTDDTLGFSDGASLTLFMPTFYGYYFRLEYVDRNNRIITGTPNSFTNSVVRITRPSRIMHSIKIPSTSKGATEWDRLKVSTYRTLGAKARTDIVPIFFKVDDTPALRSASMSGFIGAKASDAQIINTLVIADTTQDFTLAPEETGDTLIAEANSGNNPGTDDISDAQLRSLGGSTFERPISAARSPKSQYIVSTTIGSSGHLIYGNITSDPTLTIEVAQNGDVSENLVGAAIGLRAVTSNKDYEIEVKFVDSGNFNINSIVKVVDVADGSDFVDPSNESQDAGFLELTLPDSTITTDHESEYIQIISKPNTFADSDNQFIGSLIGWHKITKVDLADGSVDKLIIRVPAYIADEFSSVTPIDSLQCVLILGGSTSPSTEKILVPCWDVAYDDTPSQDVTLPNDTIGRVAKNWAKAINTVMSDNGYYKRIEEELNEIPVANDIKVSPNFILGDWGYTKWGKAVGFGRVEITQQISNEFSFYVYTNSLPARTAVFSNGFTSPNPIIARPKVFPSRIVISYGNYPESVDNPYADNTLTSNSIIDINPSDGQEITGMARFFSESSSGGAQYSGTLIVFKTNSVYAVDIASRSATKLQSMGQGCTVPDSIASTDDTIFFANDTGIYKVTRDLNVKYVGDLLDRYYEGISKTNLKLRGYGIADNFDLSYKLALPVNSEVNDEIAVYNFESMSKQAEGSWALYDNIPISSAKQTSNTFWFGNFKGRIWENRNANDNTDYRDDDDAVSASFTYGPQAFGDPGKTKDMSHVIVQYADNGPTAATVSMALDLNQEFTTLDPTNAGEGSWKGINVAYSPPPTKAVYYQVKIDHDVKDEPCVVNGLVFKVSIGNEQAIRQAADGKDGAKK